MHQQPDQAPRNQSEKQECSRRTLFTSPRFPDAFFDAAIATFVFCTLPDELQVPALRELGRLVRPQGTIGLLDYTRPRGRIRRLITQLWEPWVGWAYGAHFNRQTEQFISEAGLVLTSAHFVVDDLIRLIEAKPACSTRLRVPT